MRTKWKITLAVLFVLVAAVATFAGIRYNQRGVVTVQTGKVVRQDLTSLVTASGEIKPRNYINLGTNAIGPSRITNIYVIEGDRVRKGQVLAKLESVQAESDVAAQRAAVSSSLADSSAGEAGVKAADENVITAQATVERMKAQLDQSKVDFERSEKLFKEKLVASQEFDTKRFAMSSQAAALREAEARVQQARAQRDQIAAQLAASQRRVSQIQANLRRASDILDKYNVYAPIDGMVTNLPVRVGETVVPGIQNSAASTIMTIADMSLITAEVKVDETDIVNVKLGQQAEISIDAIPGRTFLGKVIEIGNTAILRSTGVAASQSAISSQEAKDFKVVVALSAPPDDIRPGLSCTSRVITATRKNVLSIPLQALTVRRKADLDPLKKGDNAVAAASGTADKDKKEEMQGVFIVSNEKSQFQKVNTGVTGTTDIEVTSGLKEGDQIITGSYKVIRTLRNETKVKIDNKPPGRTES